MKVKTLLVLGRVSNLPTIWTNVFAAALISHVGNISQSSSTGHSSLLLMGPWEANASAGIETPWLRLYTVLALSFMYIGGMYLNDAFDEQWDRLHDNLRPLVSGEISAQTVWLLGGLFLVLPVIGISAIYQLHVFDSTVQAEYQRHYGSIAASILAFVILLYNWTHKKLAYTGAFLMGMCRFGVYIIAALLLSELTLFVVAAGISLLLYITGLTFLARNESVGSGSIYVHGWPLLLLLTPLIVAGFSGYDSAYFWGFLIVTIVLIYFRLAGIRLLAVRSLMSLMDSKPNGKAYIGGLLCAIPLIDGLMLASVQAVIPSIFCVCVFLMMPRLHRWISGT